MIYRPENVIYAGIATYLCILLIGPVYPVVDLSLGSLLFIFLTTSAFILGSRLADGIGIETDSLHTRSARPNGDRIFFWFICILGVAGIGLRWIHRYGTGGFTQGLGLEAREMLIDSGQSTLSIVGAILYPFCYLPLFMSWTSGKADRGWWQRPLAVTIFFLPMLEALVLYSRSSMLVSITLLLFGLRLNTGRRSGRSLKLPAISLLLIVATAVASASIFLYRLEQMGIDLYQTTYFSGYAHTVTPSDTGQRWIREGSVLANSIHLTQYYTHAPFEFQILWDQSSNQDFSFGKLHLFPYIKALSLLRLSSLPDFYQLFPRVGVFTTFWGPLWVDFGWFSPIFTFFFGVISRLLGRQAEKNQLRAMPLYAYFCVILFFMPVVNLWISSEGLYKVTVFTFFWTINPKGWAPRLRP